MALWRAIVNGAEDAAVKLLSHKRVDVNYQHHFESHEPIRTLKVYQSLRGLSILHVASLACCPKIVNILIQRGANPLTVDRNCTTPRELLWNSYIYLLDRHTEAANEILNILFYGK